MDPKKKDVRDEDVQARGADEALNKSEENRESAAREENLKEGKTSVSDDNKKLETELKAVEEERDMLKDKYLRLSAEFDNYRKRTMKEKAELVLNGGEKSITSILPVIDDLERALKNMKTAQDVEAVRSGVELIYNKFMSVLGQNGVKVIDTKDQPLNTDFHEAIAVIPAQDENQKGKILDCVQTGYTLNDKVIRHAKVVVGE